jgi:altronate dehydratase
VISDRDNVATALEPLEPGRVLELTGASVTVREEIPRGHKVALSRIAAGEAVIKYGSPIGLASADIEAGGHVHTHNVSSSRGRGDLGSSGARGLGDSASEVRLAEPSDEISATGRDSAAW